MRWRILSQKPHTIRELDLILGMESVFKVAVLGWESRSEFLVLSVSWVSGWSEISSLFFVFSNQKSFHPIWEQKTEEGHICSISNPLFSLPHCICAGLHIMSYMLLTSILDFPKFGRSISFFACRASQLTCLKIAQTSVALIGLTATVNDGTNYNDTYVRIGTASVTDLTCYFNTNDPSKPPKGCPTVETIQGLAHLFGEQSLGFPCKSYLQISDVQESKENYRYFCRRTDPQEFAYRFLHYNPNDTQHTYPLLTNRTITASAGRCFEYSGEDRPELAKDPSYLNYTFHNDSSTGHIQIPIQSGGNSGTTYIYPGRNFPPQATQQSCGPRCIWMWAHKSTGKGEKSTFYQCPVTVNDVSKVYGSWQNISDDTARIAAAAIGLDGRWTGRDKNRNWMQYQFYSYGYSPLLSDLVYICWLMFTRTAWEIHNKTTEDVGANMAEFAIGSIATMVTRNPPISVNDDRVPHLGSRLVIFWHYALPLCFSIIVIHLALFVSAIYVTKIVLIKDDSDLSTARLLRSLVTHLNDSGTILDSKEICGVLGRSHQDGVVYGPRSLQDPTRYVLDIGQGVQPREDWPQRQHPSGRYIWKECDATSPEHCLRWLEMVRFKEENSTLAWKVLLRDMCWIHWKVISTCGFGMDSSWGKYSTSWAR